MAFLAGMLPTILGAVGGKAGVLGAVSKTIGGAGKRRRRARRRLTAGELQELSQIKAILGKTAAANALPFYMGRR